MWPWVIGSLSLAAAVNQIAIALCRRAQAAHSPSLVRTGFGGAWK
jgi:hypothetical protein